LFRIDTKKQTNITETMIKKMKTLIFIFLFFCISILETIAQRALEGADAQNNLNALGTAYSPANNTVRTFDDRYKGFKGTACVFDKWYPTDIYFTNGTKFENQPCKFDIYKQQDLVVLRKAKKDSIVLQNQTVSAFAIYNEDTEKKHTFKKYFLEKGDKEGFFCEVLAEGKNTVLYYREKTLLLADFKGAYSAARFYDEFLLNAEYYMLIADNQIIKLKKNEKSLLKILPEHQEKMKVFLKENPLDFKNEETIAKAVSYYNSL
jgi:hypothetical protein